MGASRFAGSTSESASLEIVTTPIVNPYRPVVAGRPIDLDIRCATCGALAMHLRTTEPGDPMWTPSEASGDDPLVTASGVGVLVEAGGHRLWLATGDMDGRSEAVRAAMLAPAVPALHRLDDELVPFYCPECATSYCEAHWETWSVFDADDPAWFDELRGRCPVGHERRIYD